MRLIKLATRVGFSLYLAIPALLFAQAGIPKQIVPCGGVDCRVCDLATLAQNLINTGIFIVIFLSAILFAYAGFVYLSAYGDEGKIKKAHEIFSDVAIGLVIILSAWLIVDTLMHIMTGTKFGQNWSVVC